MIIDFGKILIMSAMVTSALTLIGIALTLTVANSLYLTEKIINFILFLSRIGFITMAISLVCLILRILINEKI